MEPHDDPEYYEAACAGKDRFPSEGAALGFLRAARRSSRKSGIGKMHHIDRLIAYECPFCQQWHVGGDHNTSPFRKSTTEVIHETNPDHHHHSCGAPAPQLRED